MAKSNETKDDAEIIEEEEKRLWYWRMCGTFFDSDLMKLMIAQGCDAVIVILIQLYCRSLPNEGYVCFDLDTPYSTEELAILLGRTTEEVDKAIQLLQRFKLLTRLPNGLIYCNGIEEHIHEIGEQAERKRKARWKAKAIASEQKLKNLMLSSAEETKAPNDGNFVPNCGNFVQSDVDVPCADGTNVQGIVTFFRNSNSNSDSNSNSVNSPSSYGSGEEDGGNFYPVGDRPRRIPSVSQIQRYAKRIGFRTLDALAFYQYYERHGWKDGKGNPICDWKRVVDGWYRRRLIQEQSEKEVSDDGNLHDSRLVKVDCIEL